VDPSGAILGIFSERDMVRAIAERQAAALDEPVSNRMTRDIVTCSLASPVTELMSIMTTGKFRHVPVVEAGRLGGIVSIGDIVKHRIAEVEAEHQAMRDYIATA
jgi:CBS domain-containing protein